ncbi:MAG: NifB/NifX family molybdenum-iron cluster-binding protein [Myxococcota bacterium]|nr:NifB/NifX family molybdenum-iron cluster-binding protein [Myxococcota bacterium]
MQIAVAAEDDKGLDGQVSMHFGRCPYYVMAEVKGGKIIGSRVEQNAHYGNHQPGQMPVFIRDLGANVILAGGMGPRAVDMFQRFGIEVATGAVGNIGKVLDAYLRGEIKGIVPCSHDHPESCAGHD